MPRAHVALLSAVVLAGCERAAPPAEPPPRDPAVVQALNDPLMVDPDLSQRNEAAAALTVSTDTRLPVLSATPEAIAAARDEAAKAVGGADRLVQPPPAAGQVAGLPSSWSARAHLRALGAEAPCLAALEGGMAWAARMPLALPIYPRGAALGAAGIEKPGCRARAVRFATAVPVAEVVAFYWVRARGARLAPHHLAAPGRAVLRGGNGDLAFDVRIGGEGGETVVELATLGR